MNKHLPAMIDPAKVKDFWDRRGEKLGEVPFESIANLEENPALLALKTELEQACILPLLPLEPRSTILDLGAGVGQWSFRFAPKAAKVTAVEYSPTLAKIGRDEALRRNLGNLEFIVSPAEEYASPKPFDFVFISGLFVYLTDHQAARLLGNLPQLVKLGGRVVLRDGTSILGTRHQIVDRHSDILNAKYSAIYRTAAEYAALFSEVGMRLVSEGQIFPESSPLNKFPETRLRYYVFEYAVD